MDIKQDVQDVKQCIKLLTEEVQTDKAVYNNNMQVMNFNINSIDHEIYELKNTVKVLYALNAALVGAVAYMVFN